MPASSGRSAPRPKAAVTDVARWERTAHEVPAWDARNAIIGSYVLPGSTVLDLGAGAQTLRQHLDHSCGYQAADIVPGQGVLHCDLNAGELPEVEERFTYVVLSGVAEYLMDVEAALASIRPLGQRLLVSYATREKDGDIAPRTRQGWLSHLTAKEFEAVLTALDLPWVRLDRWHGQNIYFAWLPSARGKVRASVSDIDTWIKEARVAAKQRDEAIKARDEALEVLKKYRPVLLAVKQAGMTQAKQDKAIQELFPPNAQPAKPAPAAAKRAKS
jgi:hypothetical protein